MADSAHSTNVVNRRASGRVEQEAGPLVHCDFSRRGGWLSFGPYALAGANNSGAGPQLALRLPRNSKALPGLAPGFLLDLRWIGVTSQKLKGENMILPEHMDKGSRNRRLYETLKGMGLFVTPIPDPSDPNTITEMIVSVELPWPQPTQQATERCISPVVKGAKIHDAVTPAKSDGGDVIDFPSKLG